MNNKQEEMEETNMKMIKAIVRPERLDAVKDALKDAKKDVKQGAEKAKTEIKEGYEDVKKRSKWKLNWFFYISFFLFYL